MANSSDETRGRQPPDAQGEKTHAAFIDQLESGPSGESRDAADTRAEHEPDGKHRLFEGREQHDEADLNSEKNRLDRDIREHGHNRENFQVRGGSSSTRVEPRNPINPEHPDAPTPGADKAPRPQRVPGEGAS